MNPDDRSVDREQPGEPKQNPSQPKTKAMPPRGPLPRNYGAYEHWPTRFVDRRARIRMIEDASLRESAEAMCVFDEGTDPLHVAIREPLLARAIGELTVYLLHRVLQRAASARHDLEFEAPEHDEGQRLRANAVEVCFRESLRKAFPAPQGTNLPIDQRKFERAFARFTAGELRLPATGTGPAPDPLALDGIPDGPYFFCFAEAALLFLRLRIEPEFWRRLLPTFIAGTPTFTLNYWDGSARALDAYAGANHVPNMSSRGMLASLRQHFAVLELPRLLRAHGETLATALRDEPRIPHPVRTPLELR